MKYFTILFFIICVTNASARKHKATPLKISQYDYYDFIDEYGLDDTSIVLIDLFLKKRIEQGIGEMSFLPLSSATTLIIPPVGIVLTAISLPVAIHGGYIYIKYSKKRLSKILTKYQNGKHLSKGLMKKVKNHYKLMEIENRT